VTVGASDRRAGPRSGPADVRATPGRRRGTLWHLRTANGPARPLSGYRTWL